jgi:alkyl sulfatase BDS1-like metallo-beta-lactamase superfamily hydrolase
MTGYLGWFRGDATEIAPLPRTERASRTVALMGGPDRVVEAVRAALDDGDRRWCAELAGLCVSIDAEDHEARLLKAAGLRLLGYAEQNALRRNLICLLRGLCAGRRPLGRRGRAPSSCRRSFRGSGLSRDAGARAAQGHDPPCGQMPS